MSQSMSDSDGREGYNHRFISDMSVGEMRERMDQLLAEDPSEWSESDDSEWGELSREVRRRRDGSRVFSIGDEGTLVGFEMTKTNGAVGFMDDYNQNEYDVIITGYNSEDDKWEVMITEDTLEDLVDESCLDDERWRDHYITERPANGGVSGYVMTCTYQGRLGEEGSYRKQGVYQN